MLGEKKFQISLIISFLIHSSVLFYLPPFQTPILPKTITPIEVTYLKLEKEFKEKKAENKIISKSYVKPPPFIDRGIFNIKRQKLQKEPISIEKFALEKKVILPEIPSPKITSPAYLTYYQKIREKIRICAYRNYTCPEEGEVYLSFCVASNGSLKKVDLQEEKSKATEYLKNIALKSVRDGSPYPAFPKDLEFGELSFNVIISFEAE